MADEAESKVETITNTVNIKIQPKPKSLPQFELVQKIDVSPHDCSPRSCRY